MAERWGAACATSPYTLRRTLSPGTQYQKCVNVYDSQPMLEGWWAFLEVAPAHPHTSWNWVQNF